MELLALKERILINISAGESQFREFKSAYEGPRDSQQPRDARDIAEDIGRTLVGFANADGGELLVGVEDDGTITGVPHKQNTVENLLRAHITRTHSDTPLPSPIIQKINLDGKLVIYFSVDKGTQYIHLTSDGRCLQRRDRETVPVSAEQLQFERREQLSREYDRHFIDGASINDLDTELIEEVSQRTAGGVSPEKFLQYSGLGEYGQGMFRIRRAALLLFANDIHRWHPRCEVRVVRISGTELKPGADYNVTTDEIASGNIVTLVNDRAWEKLRPHLVQTKFFGDARFRQEVMYPEGACMEALINAIAHRDYSIEGRNIEILVFDDRMEVHSPGALLSTVSVEDLKKLRGLHQSRNALIAKVLTELGYMREMGEGIRRIFKLMKDNDFVPPALTNDANEFCITLQHKSVFSDADERWLKGFEGLDLTRDEMLIALLGKQGDLLSTQKIIDSLDIVDIAVYTSILHQMQVKGIIYNAAPRASSKQGKERRRIPRYAIRNPRDCARSLEELYSEIARNGTTHHVNATYVRTITSNLSDDNIYRNHRHSDIYLLFSVLGLIDESRQPTDLLQGIWRGVSLSATRSPTDRSMDSRVPSATGPKVTRSLFVAGFGHAVDRAQIEGLLRPFGRILSIAIPKNHSRQTNQSYAFVRFEEEEEAATAMKTLNGSPYNGRVLFVNWARTEVVQE